MEKSDSILWVLKFVLCFVFVSKVLNEGDTSENTREGYGVFCVHRVRIHGSDIRKKN